MDGVWHRRRRYQAELRWSDDVVSWALLCTCVLQHWVQRDRPTSTHVVLLHRKISHETRGGERDDVFDDFAT